MTFLNQDATKLIPQKSPFVLVDRLLYADEKQSICSFKIPEHHIFVKHGFYTTSGLVESMAQAAAAGTGFLNRQENKPVPIGYIGAVQKLEVTGWPPANGEIIMEIHLLTNIMQVSLVSGTILYNGLPMATCEMKIFLTNQT